MEHTQSFQWKMTGADMPFVKESFNLPEPAPGEVLVRVAGCGVCHTDVSYWHHGVKTKHELPLTLGHEISGTVVAGDPAWIHKSVIIPAVLPCGECDLCRSGRSNICRKQKMPGNDFHGGFASHILVPSRFLCPVPDSVLKKYPLEQLSVVADAISTPYQVVKKSELTAGDLAIVIGAGGVGIYGAQLAKIFGAKVLVLDINDEKLSMAKANGCDAVLNSKNLDLKMIKDWVKNTAAELKAPSTGWKIFEFSGSKAGQDTAFGLITFASTLSIVGFTMEKTEVRLSNLMAFDARIIGTWGCRAELYPEVIELIDSGKLNPGPFVQTFPMSKINEVFNNTLEHKYNKRSVLVPD